MAKKIYNKTVSYATNSNSGILLKEVFIRPSAEEGVFRAYNGCVITPFGIVCVDSEKERLYMHFSRSGRVFVRHYSGTFSRLGIITKAGQFARECTKTPIKKRKKKSCSK